MKINRVLAYVIFVICSIRLKTDNVCFSYVLLITLFIAHLTVRTYFFQLIIHLILSVEVKVNSIFKIDPLCHQNFFQQQKDRCYSLYAYSFEIN